MATRRNDHRGRPNGDDPEIIDTELEEVDSPTGGRSVDATRSSNADILARMDATTAELRQALSSRGSGGVHIINNNNNNNGLFGFSGGIMPGMSPQVTPYRQDGSDATSETTVEPQSGVVVGADGRLHVVNNNNNNNNFYFNPGVPVQPVVPENGGTGETNERTHLQILDQFSNDYASRMAELRQDYGTRSGDEHGEYLRMCDFVGDYHLSLQGTDDLPPRCQDEHADFRRTEIAFALSTDNAGRSAAMRLMLDQIRATDVNSVEYEWRNKVFALAARLYGNDRLVEATQRDFQTRTGRGLVLNPQTNNDYLQLTQMLVSLGAHQEAFSMYDSAIEFVLSNHQEDVNLRNYYIERYVSLGCMSRQLNFSEAQRLRLVEFYRNMTGEDLDFSNIYI